MDPFKKYLKKLKNSGSNINTKTIENHYAQYLNNELPPHLKDYVSTMLPRNAKGMIPSYYISNIPGKYTRAPPAPALISSPAIYAFGAPPAPTLGSQASMFGAPPAPTLGAQASMFGAPPAPTLGAQPAYQSLDPNEQHPLNTVQNARVTGSMEKPDGGRRKRRTRKTRRSKKSKRSKSRRN